MTVEIADDVTRVGYAVLDLGADRDGALRVSIAFPNRTFLGPDGKRSRERHLFTAVPQTGSRRRFTLGPEVTAHVREAEFVTLADAAGAELGSAIWEGVRAPMARGGEGPIRDRDPAARADARTGPGAGQAPPPPEERTPEGPAEAVPPVEAGPPAGPEAVVPPVVARPVVVKPRRGRRRAALAGLAVLLLVLGYLALAASGLVGWTVQPSEASLSGPRGGPFRPAGQSLSFAAAWYVRPLEPILFGDAGPFATEAAPAWLRLRARRAGPGAWDLAVEADTAAARALEAGTYRFPVPLRFPLRLPFVQQDIASGAAVALSVASEPGRLVLAPTAPLVFEGPAGGPFEPGAHRVTLRNQGGSPVAWRLDRRAPWIDVAPSSGRIEAGESVALTVTPGAAAGRAREPAAGEIGFGGAAAVAVRLVIRQPPEPPREPPRSPVDDAACDRVAGNPFDPDRPAGRGSVEEVAALADDDIAGGLVWCDARTDRTGSDRRFAAERGRLLAERAARRVRQGDLPGARADMDEAVRLWLAAADLGSAYADNLLGAYHKGTFNRPALAFTQPSDEQANAYWLRGMQRGSVIAERNYASQLLFGFGMARADPPRAVGLLQDALARGDVRAAGVLGVAYYTGNPPDVPRDRTEGWRLIRTAQCVDKAAGEMVAREIAAGRQPAADRRACP